MYHRIGEREREYVDQIQLLVSMNVVSETATDLYVSRREGAGRARENPGAPGTGRGWSTDCLAEEGSLKTQTTCHYTM